MNLYPDAAIRFANESGSCRTSSSRSTTLQILRQLQYEHKDLPIDQFTTGHLTRFCLGHAPNTVRNRRSKIRSFFEWATYMRFVKSNPASDLKFTVKAGHEGVLEHHWLSELQVADLIRSCPDDPGGRRARVLAMVGFTMGLRRHELAGLRWDQFTPDLSRYTFVGKGTKLATLGVPPQTRIELQSWRREAPLGCTSVLPVLLAANNRPETIYWQRPISSSTIPAIVRTLGERVGITDLRPHDMRRSFAGILEAKGLPITDISRMLRHSNVGVTSVYLESNPTRTSALADTFELAL
jgi:integrase